MEAFLGFINSGVLTGVSILKWLSIAVFVFQVTVLGFTIMNSSKDGSDALTKVKEKIIPLAIGFFLIIASGTLQKVIKNAIDSVDAGKANASNVISNSVVDEFNWS